VRSRHEELGTFLGPTPAFFEAISTFRADPFPLGANDEIDPGIWNWFDENEIPMRRAFEWRFVGRGDQRCNEPGEDQWALLESSFARVDPVWTSEDVCFAVRPQRREGPSEVKPIIAAAVTTWHRYRYVPPRERQPIYYQVLLDLEIPTQGRCTRVKNEVLNAIERAIDARGTPVRLGVYTPLDRDTGEPLGGCAQQRRQLYPVADILRDADDAARDASPERIKVVWIYVNNLDLPPPAESASQLADLAVVEEGERSYELLTWAIASTAILSGFRAGEIPFSWDLATGWRPVEDETFVNEIRATARREMPFFTMRHDDDTLVEVLAPEGTDPQFFKVCGSTPISLTSVGVWSSGFPIEFGYPQAPAQRWGEDGGPPFFKIQLEPQILVTADEYTPVEIDVIVEVCENFCNNPFRTRGGVVFQNWREPAPGLHQEVCQWSE